VSLKDTFARTRAEGRAALIGYLPAGFPTVDESIDLMKAMVEGGCDVIEVGLPYSDPVMDGPTIQAAAQQALENGVRTADLFRVVEAVAATGADVVVMTYWNPVERYGVERFAAELAAAGGQGMITPDMIPDEAEEWLVASEKHGLDRIFLVAPSSTEARLAMTVEHCSGFVYATAVMGVTGAREHTSDLAAPLVTRTREVTDLPVCVGLGVSTAEQASEVATFADGVIVGSAFVRRALAAGGTEAVDSVRDLAAELAKGVRGA
jgi:tryptophan synthase alpha chain